jgi:hypothetical protein
MGLNDSFFTIRAQILLIDALPFVNKVFSLIIQEERQREITVSSLSHDTSSALMTRTLMPNPAASSMPNPHECVAFMTKTTPGPMFTKQNYMKDCSIYSYCGVARYTIEKCYKVHSYPLGFKFTRNKPNKYVQHSSNQVQGTNLTKFPHLNNPPQLIVISEQCQQLMELLKQYPIQSPQPFVANLATITLGYFKTLNPKYSVFFASFVNIVPHLK